MKKRVFWKLPFIHSIFFKKRFISKLSPRIRIRNSTLPFSFVSKRIRVYNGIWYLSSDVVSNMVGFKLGQFSYTRRFGADIHSKDKRKRKKKAKNLLLKKAKLADMFKYGMGHLINSRSTRLGWFQHWWDVWFSKNSHYAELQCLVFVYDIF